MNPTSSILHNQRIGNWSLVIGYFAILFPRIVKDSFSKESTSLARFSLSLLNGAFFFYYPCLLSIQEKANCIAVFATRYPHSLGSYHFGAFLLNKPAFSAKLKREVETKCTGRKFFASQIKILLHPINRINHQKLPSHF